MSCRSAPVIFWPFMTIWKLVEFTLKAAGRLIAALLGLVLVILGIVLCVTIIGAIIGIPIGGFGFSLIVKGFFFL